MLMLHPSYARPIGRAKTTLRRRNFKEGTRRTTQVRYLSPLPREIRYNLTHRRQMGALVASWTCCDYERSPIRAAIAASADVVRLEVWATINANKWSWQFALLRIYRLPLLAKIDFKQLITSAKKGFISSFETYDHEIACRIRTEARRALSRSVK